MASNLYTMYISNSLTFENYNVISSIGFFLNFCYRFYTSSFQETGERFCSYLVSN